MNIVAIDIGNTNVTIGLFLADDEKSVESVAGGKTEEVAAALVSAWEQVPFVKHATEPKREGVIVVSSVKDEWTKMVSGICKEKLDEKIKLIGKDIPLPIETGVDNPLQVGTDRIVSAAAAFAVVEDAVVVADFGTAVTIDLVDEQGVFMGGVIAPGFDLSANALSSGTAKLPKVKVRKISDPVGANTEDAINCGLYYSAIGLLKTVVEKYAEQLGKWPQTIVTGRAFEIIKDDCDFVDSWVLNLPVKGIVLAYKKYLDDQAILTELDDENEKRK
jgi:type III pantothenate kinase